MPLQAVDQKLDITKRKEVDIVMNKTGKTKLGDVYIVLMTSIIFAVTVIAGCQGESGNVSGRTVSGSSELRVGYIDSEKLLMEHPEYKRFLEEKDRESIDIKNLIDRGRKAGTLSNEEQDYIKDKTKQYIEAEDVIIESFVSQVREASKQVMNEKKLDLVINNPWSGTIIQYGGTDITEDVKSKMTGLDKQEGTAQED